MRVTCAAIMGNAQQHQRGQLRRRVERCCRLHSEDEESSSGPSVLCAIFRPPCHHLACGCHVLERLSSSLWTLKPVGLVLSACSSTAVAGVRVLSFQVVPFHVLPYHQQIPTRSTTWDVLVFPTAPLWFHPGHPLVL